MVIGSGKVATALSLHLKKEGKKIKQVFSRNIKHAVLLAKKLNAQPIHSLKQLDKNADCCIIAVKDDAIREVAKKIRLRNTLVIHTSGTVPLKALKKCSENTGVMYPLQTFGKGIEVGFNKVPLLIEGNNNASEKILRKLAATISRKVLSADSEKRKAIHLAAVFANNFSNHLFAVADDILKREKLDISLLLPLVEQTVENLKNDSPKKNQTGPAKRNDKKTIREHLKKLSGNEKKIYRLLTQAIQQS